MRGIILKEFYMVKTQGKIMLLIIVFYSLISVLYGNIGMGAFVFLFVAILPMSNLTYDEHYNWDGYAISMPVGRNGIVKGRYLFCLIMMGIAVAWMAVLIGGIALVKGMSASDMKDMTSVVLMSVISSAVFQTLLMPIILKLGSEKGRIVMLAILILPTLGVIAYSRSSLPRPTPQQLDALSRMFVSPVFYAALLAAMALMYAVSYAASLRIYRKKEF